MIRSRQLAAALITLAAAFAPLQAAGGAVPQAGSSTAAMALFPLEDLSAAAAPVEAVEQHWRAALEARGFQVLPAPVVEAFLQRHRVRWTGGISKDLGKSLQEETGAAGVLIASIDLYDARDVPRFALTARLVSAGEDPRILWMDTASGAGDEAPGVLGLGLVFDIEVIADRVIDHLAGSLVARTESEGNRLETPKPARKRRPRSFFRSPEGAEAWKAATRTAVLPFANATTSPRAGGIVTLQILRALVNGTDLEVIEPGVVREALLQSRLIQEEGLSVPQASLLRVLLGADLALFGEVTEYVEDGPEGFEPAVDFSVRGIDTARGQVIWSSISQERGFEGAVFFGAGRIVTAHRLTSEMSEALVATLEGSRGAR